MKRHTHTAILSALLASPAAAQWTVTNLHPAGASSSSASGVHEGQQVGAAKIGGQDHASLWSGTAASWIDLHPAGAYSSNAAAIWGEQQVGTVYTTQFSFRAALWHGSPTWVQLHNTQSRATAVANGQQGGYFVGGESHAGLWSGSAASWVDLHPPGVTISNLAGVADGQQVGYANVSAAHACLWTGTAASWMDLHPAGAGQSWAWGVSGGVQVGAIEVPLGSGIMRAGRWTGTAASWQSLHPAGATSSAAYGVSAGFVVGYATIGGNTHASVWTETAASWVDLHAFLPATFTNSTAIAAWSDGSIVRVVGSGFNSTTNRQEALLWEWSPCYPDCEDDGDLDIFDYLCFLNEFTNQAGYADCEKDGDWDLFDYLCFQGLFASGC